MVDIMGQQNTLFHVRREGGRDGWRGGVVEVRKDRETNTNAYHFIYTKYTHMSTHMNTHMNAFIEDSNI